jgi:hypothetical protein
MRSCYKKINFLRSEMAKIYISSTYVDLKEEREAAAQAVRRLGHQSIAMEDYVASDKCPVKKCLQVVRSCNVYMKNSRSREAV